MNKEIVFSGFAVQVKQIKSKKSEKRFDLAEFFIPEISGNIKIFQEASTVFNDVIEDKLKGLVLLYDLTCKLNVRYDGSIALQVTKITKKK
jgi:hypothetical protein